MDKDIKDMEGIEIFLGYPCNVSCTFCFQEDARAVKSEFLSRHEVFRLLEQAYTGGKRFVIFSGGEPTLHPHLLDFVVRAQELGFSHIRVHTNGLRFASSEYLHRLYNAGLSGITLSVHGYGKMHDRITKSEGSFRIIEKALVNFQKLKENDSNFAFDTNTVLCPENYRFLAPLIHFLGYFSIGRVMFAYPYNTNTSKERLEKIIIPYSLLTIELKKILPLVRNINHHFTSFVLESVPYCLIDAPFWDFVEKNYRTKKDAYYPGGQVGSTEQYTNGKIKYPECAGCSKYLECYGFSQDYHILYGKPDFISLT